jgi:hypothetical protein
MSLHEQTRDPKSRKLVHAAMNLRQRTPALWQDGRDTLSFDSFYPRDDAGMALLRKHRDQQVMLVHRRGRSVPQGPATPYHAAMYTPDSEAFTVVNFSTQARKGVEIPFPGGNSGWQVALNTDDPSLGGKGRMQGQSEVYWGKTEDGRWAALMDLPPRTMLVFTKGGQGAPELAGVTLAAQSADTPPEVGEDGKQVLRNSFAVI